jgi:predicted amidophosphoribosyltransferase
MPCGRRDEVVLSRQGSTGRLPGVLDRLLALLVPPACLACAAPLPRAGEPLCRACRAELAWLGPATCRRCGQPPPCAPCPGRAAAWTRAWAPLAHDGTARELVGVLKFRGRLAAADVMAAQLAANAPPGLLRDATLVPVPAHAARRRARGFDQAAVLARALARRTGAPLATCLERVDGGARQLGAGRARRRAAGRLEVRCRGPAPAIAALVDDVHTTGATLDACARALRAGGARRVVAVTYTRALP